LGHLDIDRKIIFKWCEDIDWLNLAEDGDKWWALVSIVMNLQVP
jgi:hypothetical protein